MYAIIKNGGKQYRVMPGQTLKLELFEAEPGSQVNLTDVLMIADGENVQIGAPMVKNATVTAEVLKHGRAKKVEIIKFRRRKHYMKRQGHRQHFTEVKITGIKG